MHLICLNLRFVASCILCSHNLATGDCICTRIDSTYTFNACKYVIRALFVKSAILRYFPIWTILTALTLKLRLT